MSSISSSPRYHNPSKPVVVRVPTLSINSNNMHGLGNEDDKSYSCSVVKGSVLVPRGNCSDGNDKDSGRERLKRHREEVAGRVSIPDKWGKEELLRDWMDCSSFDSLLAPSGLASARKALMAEGRRSSSQRFMRLGSMC
ncbi:Tubulin/FtsZ family protein isoform 1 [Hibiscus syriacus]|uniref:Tubulin/FtsZ family protein isoform 1 n=1 Tax=Hibiscus syriacus TaxID=106335 RepID=A0A6A3CJ86_HIBSY|nr:Tubulin/FtsZ family protein isoform 1 [Hibiscus syriacus]